MHEDRLKLAFVGDVCLGFFRREPRDISGFAGWRGIRRAIGEHDFLVGNLECCLVDQQCSDQAKQQPMAVPASASTFLRDAGFTDLCLANNHSMDCGSEAAGVTRERLTAAGIRRFGTGANLVEAEQPVLAQCNGRTVAFLGACDRSETYATAKRSGIAPLARRRLGDRVRVAAAKADLVVVTLHADLEFSEVPGVWRKRLCRWLVDQGANLVIQHHPHVLQGVETYHGGLIAYSLGNFVFPLQGNTYQNRHPRVFDSAVLVVNADFKGGAPSFDFRAVPIRIDADHFPRQTVGPDCKTAQQELDRLSNIILDPAAHRRAWFRRCRKESANRIYNFYYALARREFRRAGREFLQMATRRHEHRWLLGLISAGYL